MLTKNMKNVSGRFAYIAATCILLSIGVFILFRDNTPEHTSIVKTDTRPLVERIATLKLSNPDTPKTENLQAAEGHHTEHPSSAEGRPDGFSEAVSPELEMSPEKIIPETSDAASNRIDTQDVMNTEQTDGEFSVEELHQSTHEFIAVLTAEINEKYPDIIELFSLTPEEILQKYPTEADLNALEERALQYESEFLEDMRGVVKALVWTDHTEYIVDALSQIRKTLSENWGDQVADKIMKNIEAKLDLR